MINDWRLNEKSASGELNHQDAGRAMRERVLSLMALPAVYLLDYDFDSGANS